VTDSGPGRAVRAAHRVAGDGQQRAAAVGHRERVHLYWFPAVSLRKYWPVPEAEPRTSSHTLPPGVHGRPGAAGHFSGAVATLDSLPTDETDSKQMLEPQVAVSMILPSCHPSRPAR